MNLEGASSPSFGKGREQKILYYVGFLYPQCTLKELQRQAHSRQMDSDERLFSVTGLPVGCAFFGFHVL